MYFCVGSGLRLRPTVPKTCALGFKWFGIFTFTSSVNVAACLSWMYMLALSRVSLSDKREDDDGNRNEPNQPRFIQWTPALALVPFLWQTEAQSGAFLCCLDTGSVFPATITTTASTSPPPPPKKNQTNSVLDVKTRFVREMKSCVAASKIAGL